MWPQAGMRELFSFSVTPGAAAGPFVEEQPWLTRSDGDGWQVGASTRNVLPVLATTLLVAPSKICSDDLLLHAN